MNTTLNILQNFALAHAAQKNAAKSERVETTETQQTSQARTAREEYDRDGGEFTFRTAVNISTTVAAGMFLLAGAPILAGIAGLGYLINLVPQTQNSDS